MISLDNTFFFLKIILLSIYHSFCLEVQIWLVIFYLFTWSSAKKIMFFIVVLLFSFIYSALGISIICCFLNFLITFYIILCSQLCVAVPCHIFKFWAFLGILFQVYTDKTVLFLYDSENKNPLKFKFNQLKENQTH